MKNKKTLILSIFQIVIGIFAILAFIIALINNENMKKWIITLFLAVSYVVLGVIGIIDYKSKE